MRPLGAGVAIGAAGAGLAMMAAGLSVRVAAADAATAARFAFRAVLSVSLAFAGRRAPGETATKSLPTRRGIFYRLAEGKRATAKRQPPVPIPPRLLAHMRRWTRLGNLNEYFVEWNGKPVESIKVGFKRAISLSGIPGKVTPHTLRHTAATWLMQAGVPIWEAAGFLGISPALVEKTYGHHHPAHMRSAAEAIGSRQRAAQSLVISLAEAREAKAKVPQNR